MLKPIDILRQGFTNNVHRRVSVCFSVEFFVKYNSDLN
jgi:hypothetical protein